MNSPGPHFLPGKRSQPFGSISLRPFGPLAPTSPAPCSLLFSTQAPSLQAQGHCGPQQRLIRFLILPSCPWLPGAQGQEKQCGGLGVAAEISLLARAGWASLAAGPWRQLCLVRCSVAVRFQGCGAGGLPPPIPAAGGGMGSLRLVFVAPSHQGFPCGFGVTVFSER